MAPTRIDRSHEYLVDVTLRDLWAVLGTLRQAALPFAERPPASWVAVETALRAQEHERLRAAMREADRLLGLGV